MFRQLDELGTAPRYLKQIAPEVRRLIEHYSGMPLPKGVEREYSKPGEQQKSIDRAFDTFPKERIVIYKDERSDRLCAAKLVGDDQADSLDLVGYIVIELRNLVEQTYNKARASTDI